jgi:hypothetical protein
MQPFVDNRRLLKKKAVMMKSLLMAKLKHLN